MSPVLLWLAFRRGSRKGWIKFLRFCFYTNSVSPHQLPLARELAKRLGVDNYRYVTQNRVSKARLQCGWHDEEEPWILTDSEYPHEVRSMLESCDVLMCGVRDFPLFEIRAERRLPTFYVSERWFKPIRLYRFFNLKVPGWFRMMRPSYFKMAYRMRRLLREDIPFYYLPCGVHAATDMARIVGWHRPVFSMAVPGASCEKIRLWGYFVAATSGRSGHELSRQDILNVLWVGRMLDWKRVDTLVHAVARLQRIGITMKLTLVGDGPERTRLEGLSKGLPISFLSSQPIGHIRTLMREHDVYVLSSDAGEGWGGALNEALEEGMYAIGTYEAGASATMLKKSDLFHAGDSRALARLLERCAEAKHRGTLNGQGIADWSAAKAAERMMVLMDEVLGNTSC